MKKIFRIATLFTGVVFYTSVVCSPVLAQAGQNAGVNKAIPSEVMKVIDKGCADCHKLPGMKMALGALNLSDWGKYSTEKQAAKANTMCNFVTKGKMPPKSYKNKNPDKALTSDEIKVICDWAKSLQPAN